MRRNELLRRSEEIKYTRLVERELSPIQVRCVVQVIKNLEVYFERLGTRLTDDDKRSLLIAGYLQTIGLSNHYNKHNDCAYDSYLYTVSKGYSIKVQTLVFYSGYADIHNNLCYQDDGFSQTYTHILKNYIRLDYNREKYSKLIDVLTYCVFCVNEEGYYTDIDTRMKEVLDKYGDESIRGRHAILVHRILKNKGFN